MQSNRIASSTIGGIKKESLRKGSLPHNGKKQIPRVQIFLDRHLKKAIGQIRGQKLMSRQINNQNYQQLSNQNNNNALIRHKRRSTFEQEQTMQQSYKGKNSMMMGVEDHLNDYSNSLMNSPSSNINNISKQSLNKTLTLKRSNIEIMPNDVVLDYIHEVYQKYGIENPFQGYLDAQTNSKQKQNDLTIMIREQEQQKIKVKNWHSFSQRKDRNTINQVIKIDDNQQYIDDKVNQYDYDPNNNQQVLMKEYNNTVRTQKKPVKKMSQNQQKILQLKNKFKQIDQLANTNYYQRITQQQPIRPISMEKKHSQHRQTSSFDIKQSCGNITYIDNLKNLMQSQFTQFDASAKNISFNNQEKVDKVSMKLIDSMGQILIDESEVKNQNNYMSSPKQNQSGMRPKKKLFVKTRGTSTKYNSVQATPAGDSGRKVRFENFLQSQNKQQPMNYNRNLFQINHQIYQQSTVNNSIISQPITMKQSLASQLTNSGIYIPQYHRYCLGCQQSILDSNILFHQQNCQELKKISHLPLNVLIQLVDQKLTKLKSQLGKSQLFNLKIDDIHEIRSLGSTLLKTQSQTLQKDKNNLKILKGQKENLHKIDRLLQKKVLRGCQMIKKIQWFLKLKTTMQNQIESHQNKNQNQHQQKKISSFTLK